MKDIVENWEEIHQKFHESVEEMQKLGGLRIWILHVLYEEGPKNGIEIMASVQEHTNRHQYGHYKNSGPLPGSIYPMLKKMISEGLIIKNTDGDYNLAEKGKEVNSQLLGRFKEFHPKTQNKRRIWDIENILTEIDNDVSYLEDIKTEKLLPHKELIQILSQRISKIKDSLIEE
jgi:DNA-binding PadR family transcriptional regulator